MLRLAEEVEPISASALPWRFAVPEKNWPVRREIS